VKQEQLALLLLALALGAVGALWLRARLVRRQMRRRFARGRDGERRAARLLERAGYRILEDQLSQETGFWIDDQWCPVTVRADFLVARRGKVYVAEVKTGKTAPNPAATATRRQLFEYAHVYDADGLLLVDMEARRLRCVRFDPRAARRSAAPRDSLWWLYLALGAALGLAVGLCADGCGQHDETIGDSSVRHSTIRAR
jgi:Holliday junction resolvase-like predicted endonuclease